MLALKAGFLLAASLMTPVFSQMEAARNDWISPYFVLNYHHSKCAGGAAEAVAAINSNATRTARDGPWTVLNEIKTSPDGDNRAYVSWAPYWWPDCCEDQEKLRMNQSQSNTQAGASSPDMDRRSNTEGEEGERQAILGQLAKSNQVSSSQLGDRTPSSVREGENKDSNAWGGLHSSGPQKVAALKSSTEEAKSQDTLQRTSQSSASKNTSAPREAMAEMTSNQTLTDSGEGWGGINASAPRQAIAITSVETAPPCVPRPQGSDQNPSLIWSTCPYTRREVTRNPDLTLLNAARNFVSMQRSVLFNAITFALTKDETFAQNAVRFIRVFFLDETTGVRPEIKFGQIVRGPPNGTGPYEENDYRKGTFRGVIEWRYVLEVVNAIVILRATGAKAWSTLDAAQMSKWASDYLHWLETSELGLIAKGTTNNFVSFYYNQIVSLYILLGKTKEAQERVNEYFTGPFLTQIAANGDQPEESGRSRAFHYLSFGLEAMIANAKLADNLGLNMWSAKSANGSTIRDAVDFAIQFGNQARANGSNVTTEFASLAPHVAAALTVYGDHPDGRYAQLLANESITLDPAKIRTWRFFNLPCSFYSSPSKGHTVSSQRFS